MKKLKLKIDKYWEEKEGGCSFNTMRRKINSLKFEGLTCWHPLLTKIEPFVGNIQTLEFSSMILHASVLCRILNRCMSLKELKIVHSTTFEGSYNEYSSSKNLESLAIVESTNFQFLRFLRNSNRIKNLEITSFRRRIFDTALDELNDFLSLQRNLKSLTCHGCQEFYETLSNANFVFELEKLTIQELIFERHMGRLTENILKLLANHRTTLESLEISGNLCENVIAFAMQELRVRRLKIGSTRVCWPQNLQIEQISPNLNLKKLEFDFIHGPEPAVKLFQAYPAVEYLKIAKWPRQGVNGILAFIASRLTNLVILDIPQLTIFTAGVSMQSLKMVKLDGRNYNLSEWNARRAKTSEELESEYRLRHEIISIPEYFQMMNLQNTS